MAKKTRLCKWCGGDLRLEDDLVCGYYYLDDELVAVSHTDKNVDDKLKSMSFN